MDSKFTVRENVKGLEEKELRKKEKRLVIV